jgi:hypothetical protein
LSCHPFFLPSQILLWRRSKGNDLSAEE